jgi:ubiquitin-activating enzyme E1 C
MGAQGIYTMTVSYERDKGCPICSPGVPLEVPPSYTLQQVTLLELILISLLQHGARFTPATTQTLVSQSTLHHKWYSRSPALPATVLLRGFVLFLQVIDAMMSHPILGQHLKAPSVSLGAVNLYAHGIFEEETRPNLGRIMSDLVPEQPAGVILTVNDKKLHAPMRVHLKYSSASEDGQAPMS